MNIINLKFPKDLTKLAGNSYGRKIYDEQVKGKIDFTEKTIISIPEQIDGIASSFIQGFFDDIVNQIGIIEIPGKIEVKSTISDINEFIFDNLE